MLLSIQTKINKNSS